MVLRRHGLFLGLLFASAPMLAGPPAPEPLTECSAGSGRPESRLSGVVRDGTGSRVAGAVVTAACGDFRKQATTGVDGAYALALPPGAYAVFVEARGFRAVSSRVAVPTDSGGVADFDLIVAPVADAVTVTGEYRYGARETSVATKTETPLLEIPQAVSVVDRQLMDDQQAQHLDEALGNVSGVTVGGYYEDWDYYRIRGFDASFTTYVDGLRGSSGGMGEELFGLERVEVLKGPTSMLYGFGTPGGLVNVQTKRPHPDFLGVIELTAASWSSYQPTLDFGGTLNEEKTVYVRFSGLYNATDSFVDYTHRERLYLAPALTWDIDPSTKLTLLARYRRDDGDFAMPLPADGTVLPNPNGDIPVSLFTGEPGRSNENVEWNAQGGYEVSHQFSDAFSLRQNFRYSWYDAANTNLLYPAFLGEDQRTLYRYPYDYVSPWNILDVDTSGLWRAKTGAIDHEVLVGVEYYRYRLTYEYRTITFEDPAEFMPIDLFDPVYGQPFPQLQPAVSGALRQDSTGIYMQDQVRLSSKWTATVGGRFDWANSGDETGETGDDSKFSPRIGTTYQFLPAASAYASYSESFNPQLGVAYSPNDPDGVLLPPETGTQWEVGVKAATPSGALSGTLSLFHLTRDNVATPDPGNPVFLVTTGAQRSEGVELEGALRILTGWNLTAAFTYTDAIVTEDNDIPVGTPTPGVPKNAFSGWTTYQLRSGPLAGLGFGLGGRYYAAQSGDLYDTFAIPAYGLMEASLSYRVGRLALQVNVNNLLDARYFVGAFDPLFVLPGAPRNVRARIGWTF